MGRGAAEGTAQIGAASVPGVGEEEDPALPAPREAGPGAELGEQDRMQYGVVLQDQLAQWRRAVPVGGEPELPLDRYGKKARRSLNRLIVNGMACSYHKGATMSRGRRKAAT